MKTNNYRIHLEYELSRKNEVWSRKESMQLNNDLYYYEEIDGRFPHLKNVEQRWEIHYDEGGIIGTSAHLNIIAQNKQQAAKIVKESRMTIENLLLPPYVRMPAEISETDVKE
jgi:hypothetical protein